MQESIYSALFGAMSNEHRMNLIANNLANVNTTGYKKDEVAFKDVFAHFAHDYILDSKPYLRAKPLWPEADVMAKVRLSDQRTNFAQGSLTLTGNPLDFAIQGNGFFKVMDPTTGDIFYTRNGSFSLNNAGQLIDGNGNLVQGNGGPVNIPANATVTVDQTGQITAGKEVVGSLDVVRFDDPRDLEKVGGNLYRLSQDALGGEVPVEAGRPEVPEGQESPVISASVHQGYLEASNVEVVTEMVRMIEVQRSFEAYQKIMTSTQQMDQKVIQTSSKA